MEKEPIISLTKLLGELSNIISGNIHEQAQQQAVFSAKSCIDSLLLSFSSFFFPLFSEGS
jgi:hypothetical protein